MKRILLGLGLSAMMLASAANANARKMFGLTANNQIFSMADISTPSSISGPYAISGVASGQTLVGLDARPRDGMLYALGYNQTSGDAQLYTITGSGTNFTANAVNSTATNLNLGSNNRGIGFNFIAPLENQIRITGANGKHYAINADNGSIVNTGTNNTSYAAGDIHAATTLALGATGYTNGYYGSDATDQYGFDITNNALIKFDNADYYNNNNNYPNTVRTVGVTSGLLLNATSNLGMDTWYDSSMHDNSLWLAATPALSLGAHLYEMDDNTGLAVDKGAIGTGSLDVRAIAMEGTRDASQANSSLQGDLMAGLSLNLRNILFFDSKNPGNVRRMIHPSGMTAGQTMLGIAYGYNNQLYALGYNPSNQTYQIYTVDTISGSLTAVNNTAANLDLGSMSDFGSNGNWANVGFNFIGNATDRIRIIGKRGATNVQVNAVTGAVAQTDNALNYASGDANAGSYVNLGSVAYTNGGTNNSSMLGVDFNTGALVTLDGNGNSSSGSLSSVVANLNAFLNIFGNSNNTYRNGYLDILYDANGNVNTGILATNYYGDSSHTGNYGRLNIIDNIGATVNGSGNVMGNIGSGTPMKALAAKRTSAPTNVANVGGNTQAALAVYPNPVTSTARILLPATATGMVYANVIDISGRTIDSYQFSAGNSQLTIDMGHLSAGVYTIRVQNGTAISHVKVVKQ